MPDFKISVLRIMTPLRPVLLLTALLSASLSAAEPSLTPATATSPTWAPTWQTVETINKPHARHEAAFVGLGSKLYLLGGRRIQSVDIYDPATNTWTEGKAPPVETHHFQPVFWENKIWLPGAMTGGFPREQALAQIPIYDPASDTWSEGPSLPADRRRGGSGAVIHDGKLYVVCGIINGHWDGHVAWLDVLDLKTNQWSRLPDAPRARDHFQAALVNNKIYVAGGRRSSAATKQVFDLTIAEVDVFDLATGKWSTLPAPAGNLPNLRAGSMSLGVGPLLLVAGGESVTQPHAYTQIEALDTRTGTWSLSANFARGRHGSGLARIGDTLYVAAGSGSRGGKPELDSLESYSLPRY
jgi:N-acetylneuraminic acid mutarotase